jgi:BON domain-containing protein
MSFLAHLPPRRRGKRFPVHPGVTLAGFAAGAAAAALLSPRGVVAWARSAVHERRAPDEVLCARVRARLGRLTSRPGPIEVVARDGLVELRGPVLAADADRVLAGARRVLGVRGVTDLLERRAPGDLPALQGSAAPAEPRSELAQERWTPGTRLLALAAGAGLATAGLTARIPGALTVSAMGALLTLRGATNLPLSRLLHPRAPRPPPRLPDAKGDADPSRHA